MLHLQKKGIFCFFAIKNQEKKKENSAREWMVSAKFSFTLLPRQKEAVATNLVWLIFDPKFEPNYLPTYQTICWHSFSTLRDRIIIMKYRVRDIPSA